MIFLWYNNNFVVILQIVLNSQILVKEIKNRMLIFITAKLKIVRVIIYIYLKFKLQTLIKRIVPTYLIFLNYFENNLYKDLYEFLKLKC